MLFKNTPLSSLFFLFAWLELRALLLLGIPIFTYDSFPCLATIIPRELIYLFANQKRNFVQDYVFASNLSEFFSNFLKKIANGERLLKTDSQTSRRSGLWHSLAFVMPVG